MTIARHERARQRTRGPGQPPHQPTDVTRGQVEALAGFGVSHEDIGLVIGIGDKTLRKCYRHELDAGKAKMTQNIIQKALGTGPGRQRRLARASLRRMPQPNELTSRVK